MNRVHGKVPIGGMSGQRRHEGVDAAETFVVHPPSHTTVSLLPVHDTAQICDHGRCLCGIAFHVHAGVRAECTQPLSNCGDGCCLWLRHGHWWLLAWRKDGPVGLVVGTNENRSMYWWAQIVALMLGSSVAPKTRKGVMGDSLCTVPSCVVPATCCRALASNAWRSVPWESSADVCGAGTGVTGAQRVATAGWVS